MRVTSENFTVIPHPSQGQISLLVAGLNIALDLEEARELTRQLLTGMQVLGRVERAPDRVARPPERTAPIADEAAAQQSKTGSDAAAGGAAEEPMVLSVETTTAGTPVEGTKGDRRDGKRLRGLLKVLGRDPNTAGGLDQPCFGS
jgi:hypothetical protein